LTGRWALAVKAANSALRVAVRDGRDLAGTAVWLAEGHGYSKIHFAVGCHSQCRARSANSGRSYDVDADNADFLRSSGRMSSFSSLPNNGTATS